MIATAVAETQEALRQLLLQHPKAGTIWVGFSGGLDSTALLWLASQIIPETHPNSRLHALHINHNLQVDSTDWVEHCRSVAAQLNVEFQAVLVSPDSASEEDARDARYAVFEKYLGRGDLLLLGHHQNDQAETFLMRLFRGAGVQGLSAMAPSRPLAQGTLVRPLLTHTRTQLEAVAAESGLKWIDDPSNKKTTYLRNWIRVILAAQLSQRWPDWSGKLATTAQSCADAAHLNAELAELDAGGAFQNPLAVNPELLRGKRRDLRLNNLVFHWLRSQHLSPASRNQLEDLITQLKTSSTGCWQIAGSDVHWYQQQLWVSQPVELQHTLELVLQEGAQQLSSGELVGSIASLGLPSGLKVLLRPRQEGDIVKLPGGTLSVKKFMNANKIPPWLRDSWPLLELEGEIISVVGYWSSEAWLVQGGLALNWRC